MNNHIKLAGVLVCSLFLFSACAKEEAPKEVVRPVKAVQVGGLEVLTGRTFPGQAKATQEANLSFRVNGTLNQFPVKVGDEVKKGKLMARLDPRDYEVNMRNAQGQLDRARAALKLAQSDYDRVVRIRDKDPGAISQAMIDAKLGERDSAKAQVTSLEAQVATTKDALSYTYLKAPFKGTVVETFVENFEDVQAKQAIVRIVDTSKIEFVVNIPENLISLAPKVKKVFVRFDAFPDREISGVIKEIGKEASKTTRTYPVTLIMDQPDDIKILPGMAGQARGDKESAISAGAEGIIVPVSAVFSKDGKKEKF
ncbi:MAG: efflux RND transporter periplasmic adaptor subunit, partial [Thermodesulfovibrionia bacterium]|nr:efflux RND transporter periplasmic adaptor subunit [Thermodesulfovibrionia bacterium]